MIDRIIISPAGAIPANDTLVWKRKPCPLMLMSGTRDNMVPDSMASVDDMIKAVPLYIYGYGKYLDEMNTEKAEKPTKVVY